MMLVVFGPRVVFLVVVFVAVVVVVSSGGDGAAVCGGTRARVVGSARGGLPAASVPGEWRKTTARAPSTSFMMFHPQTEKLGSSLLFVQGCFVG